MFELVADRDAERLLLNRTAATVLGVGAVLSVGAIVVATYAKFNFGAMNQSERELINYAGAASAAGMGLLFFGMALFLIKCDVPSRRGRFIWFLVLLMGQPLTTVPYYLFVYLPMVRKTLRNLGARVGSDY
jgi:hypothetical protein